MKIRFIFLSFIVSVSASLFLKADCSVSNAVENYDRLLERLEKSQEVKSQEEIKKKDREAALKRWELGFEHENLPALEGTWLISKTTNKRIINPLLTKPISFNYCTSRLPFEKRDFKDKEVIIGSRGPDFFQVNSKYPVTDDVYFDPNQNEEITYQNFGFKAVIDPRDLTYSYTIKLLDHIDNPGLARQLWINGRLNYEYISGRKIVAKGYEVEYTPECMGFVADEIEFVLVKKRDADFGPDGPIPFLEAPAYAETESGLNLITAKDKSSFEPNLFYKPYDSAKDNPKKKPAVPGLW